MKSKVMKSQTFLHLEGAWKRGCFLKDGDLERTVFYGKRRISD